MAESEAGEANTHGVWLATRVWGLLHDKYGQTVPSVRRIMNDIRAANPTESISHGQVHNILNGGAGNITEKTRRMLSTFFDVPAGEFDATPNRSETTTSAVEALAFRLSTLRPDELAAIEQIIDSVTDRRVPDASMHPPTTADDETST